MCEVLGVDILKIQLDIYHNNIIKYLLYDGWVAINIYELANKCKEWANNLPNKRYQLASYIAPISLGYSVCEIFSGAIQQCNQIDANSEPEATFKACHWIFDRLDEL